MLSAVGPGHHLSASGSCDVCGPFGSSRAGGGGSQAVVQVRLWVPGSRASSPRVPRARVSAP